MGSITRKMIDKVRREKFEAAYADQVEDDEVLGLMVASYLEWDGYAIMRAFSSALEDANFHTENAHLREAFPQAFEEE